MSFAQITCVKRLSQNWSKTFFDNEKSFIGIWYYPNNRPNIQTYALCTFTFSLQTFTIFSLINAFINVYYNFLTFITSMSQINAVIVVSYTGSLYYKYNDDANAVVDGYPRPISQDFGPRSNLTETIPDNLDAVWFDSVSSLIYFFKDEWVRH